MSTDTDLDRMAGEIIALQAIIAGLCNGLRSARLGAVAERAFEFADHVFSVGALKEEWKTPPEYMAGALNLVESLREAALADPKPQGRV